MKELTRVCFLLNVRREKIEEYKERHASVWPEMKEALQNAGWRNYSLFLREDGLLVGYLETASFEQAQAAMNKNPVNARWQAEMSAFFKPCSGAGVDRLFPLTEVFHLD